MRGILFGIGFVVAIWTVAVLVLMALGRRTQARELVTLIPNLVVLFTGLLRDPTVPRTAKLWIGFAVVWFASPLDLVPEFIPVVGPLDDAIIAVLVLRSVLRRTDRSVLFEHWRGDPSTLEAIVRRAIKPKKEVRHP